MQYERDRCSLKTESYLPALLRDILPIGLTGLALAALMAAFMSTVSTLINWGASYFVNDVYLRFIAPNASSGRQLSVSRLATVIVTVSGVYVATWVDSIGSMWELFVGMMAGFGSATSSSLVLVACQCLDRDRRHVSWI